MSNKYNIREVQIEVQAGIKLIAEVSSIDGLQQLLKDLKDKNFAPPIPKKKERQGAPEEKKLGESPSTRIEINADIPKGSLLKCNILGFKDNVPQLLRPSTFDSVTDAALILLHAVETGLRNQSVEYESFKGLYEDQNLKSGTPLSMLITNLRNSGYLDKREYTNSRKLRLTAKGDQKAIEIIKNLITS